MKKILDTLFEAAKKSSNKNLNVNERIAIKEIYSHNRLLPRLPASNLCLSRKYVKRANKFLAFQELRLKLALTQERWDQAFIIWIILLTRSSSYQLALFNRAVPFWYWKWSQTHARKLLEQSINICRKGDFILELYRFYIKKPNGKMRPIGAPKLEYRTLIKGLTDLSYWMVAHTFRNNQHAYRHNRGVWSALYETIQLIKEGGKVYEFDLRSFFNTISPRWAFMALNDINRNLAELNMRVWHQIVYEYKNLRPEDKELKTILIDADQKPYLTRTGAPQGLATSPLITTLVADKFSYINGLKMYADDGIVVVKNDKDIEEMNNFFKRLSWSGTEIAIEKSKWVTGKFVFLGVELNLDTKKLTYVDDQGRRHMIDMYSEDLMKWLKTIAQYYGRKTTGWTWELHEDSYAACAPKDHTWREFAKTIKSLWTGNVESGYKFMWGTWSQKVLANSTWSTNEILMELRDIKLLNLRKKRVKPKLMDVLHNERWNTPIDKGRYVEIIVDNSR